MAAGLQALAAFVPSLALSQGSGRDVFGTLVYFALILGMIRSGKSVDALGIHVGDDWLRQLGKGVLAGGIAMLLTLGTQLFAGTAAFNPHASPLRLPQAFLAASSGLISASFVLVLISCFAFLTVRPVLGWLGAAAAVSLLHVLIRSPLLLTSPAAVDWKPVLVTVLGTTLATLLRLRTGQFMFALGVLGGLYSGDRFVRSAHWFDLPKDASVELMAWLGAQGDIRSSLVLAGLMLLGVVLCAVMIVLRGECRPASDKVMSARFKRVYPFAQAGLFAPLDVWLSRLLAARFRIGLIYLPKLAVALAISAVNTILTLPERLLLPVVLCRRRVQDPVFILGVHRSGTTHLQNLLSLDPNLVTPRNYQVLNPLGFLFSGWLLSPLMVFAPLSRPMDSMQFSALSPNEDEHAIANMCSLSPYWAMSFPQQNEHYDRYIDVASLPPSQLRKWKRVYLQFLRQLVFWRDRRPLLKNPYNTARVALLRDMFPGARFIHIRRNPFRVYQSNMHLAAEGHCLCHLQDPVNASSYGERFPENYRQMEDAFERDAATLPPNQLVRIRFEELEDSPLEVIRQVYEQLGLEMSPQFVQRLQEYLLSIEGYRKNRFRPLEPAGRERILATMRPFFQRWGYNPDEDGPSTTLGRLPGGPTRIDSKAG